MANNRWRIAASGTRLRLVTVAVVAAIAFSAVEAFPQNGRTKVKKSETFTVVPTLITSVAIVDGALVANGLVGTTPFTAPITLTSGPMAAGATCPILNLALGPVHLNLLGLNVDTSAICLDITAIEGAGLLGDLLCAIANLLNGGNPLASVLANLTSEDQARLTDGLTQVLNQAVFIPLSRSDALAGASCDILNLALGPLDLNLLGLRVELDDCANGPVTIDITAVPGGGLLGDLLCNLGGALNNNLNSRALGILRSIADVLGQLLA
jgi:hypothetical protein